MTHYRKVGTKVKKRDVIIHQCDIHLRDQSLTALK
jgi:hypothetical protein